MYVFMYLFLQYLHLGVCAGLWWEKLDVTGIFFLSLWDSIMLYLAALKISPLN